MSVGRSKCDYVCLEGGKLTTSSEITRRKVVGGFVVEVIHEPPVTERAVCYVGYSELFGGFDESVCFMDCLEG